MSEKTDRTIPSADSSKFISFGNNSELSRYIKEVAKFPILSEEEEINLFKSYTENGDDGARNKVILSHLRLVVKMALNYKRYNISIMDLISEGNLALMHAFKKFDPSKKARFATYALIWIRSFMQDFIVKSWSSVKTNSSKVKQLLFGGNKLINNDQSANIKEISFDTFSNGEDGQDFFSNEALDVPDNQDDKIIEDEKFLFLLNAVKDLDPREKYILKSRYSEEEKTLDDLSKELSISKERVRQIQESVIKKIKNKINNVK